MTKNAQKTVALTSLKSLGGAVPEFNMTVKVSRPDGTFTEVTLKLKALRKSEWAKLRDEHIASVREAGKAADGEFTFAHQVGIGGQEAAELVCKVATGWDLDDDFTPDNLVELEDIMPSTLGAMLSNIDAALFQGRVGN